MGIMGSKRVVRTLQFLVAGMFVGLSLYIYNDYKDSKAAAEAQVNQSSVEVPTKDGESVSGIVEIGPDGVIHHSD